MDAEYCRIVITATLLWLAVAPLRAETTVLLGRIQVNNSTPVMPISYRTRASDPLPRHHHPSNHSPPNPSKEVGSDAIAAGDAVKADSTEEDQGNPEPDEEDEDEGEDVAATLFAEHWHQLGPISAEYLYTGEAFNNARGGISTKGATRYRGNFDLTLKLDTEKANWWSGGEVFVYAQQSHGRTLSQNFVGDGQYYSNIDTSPKPQQLTQLGEYWYQHKFADEALSIRFGRQDANADFAFADLGGDFINSSFVTLPNIPMPFWPFQTLGVSSLYQANEKLRLGGGAYDSGRNLGQWWVDTTSRGMFFLGQADYQPFADQEEARLTLIRLGAWYSSSDTVAVDGNRNYEGNYGFYATVDQMLFAEEEDPEQGLGAFLQFSWAPANRNQVPRNYGGGLLYRGLIAGREKDTLGAGFTLIEFSSVLQAQTGQTYENAVELFYKARLRDWLAVQPDLQYIARPYGFQRDALVVGVRFEANF
jgi:porin